MAMVYCRGCAKQIHETAVACPQCGAQQQVAVPAHSSASPSWLAISSLVLGVLTALALFDESETSRDELAGLIVFSLLGLALGCISLSQKNPGHHLATAGVVLSGISSLIYIGQALP